MHEFPHDVSPWSAPLRSALWLGKPHQHSRIRDNWWTNAGASLLWYLCGIVRATSASLSPLIHSYSRLSWQQCAHDSSIPPHVAARAPAPAARRDAAGTARRRRARAVLHADGVPQRREPVVGNSTARRQRATRAVALPRRARGLVSSRAGANRHAADGPRHCVSTGSVARAAAGDRGARVGPARPRRARWEPPGGRAEPRRAGSASYRRRALWRRAAYVVRGQGAAHGRADPVATAPAPCRPGRCRRRRSWAATRAFSARRGTRGARARRGALAPARASTPPPPPPAWHLDLAGEAAVDEVLAAPSRRDTSVGRVARTRGGPRAAVARWEAFVANDGLAGYAKRRNDPLDVCGSSRAFPESDLSPPRHRRDSTHVSTPRHRRDVCSAQA